MPNRLAQETSPYLRQHADNPVDWYPWGEEAFARARAEDKPVHLSVGYAACHWCHVMAHESFENPEIARLLNETFINIKVDRQERPDIDDIYQQVLQMMSQGGGWPLTVFMTPDGKPFFAGTYFPPETKYGRPGLDQLIPAIAETWKNRRGEIEHNIQQLVKGFETVDRYYIGQDLPTDEDIPAKAAQFFAERTDPVHGGLGDAPKFPNVSCYDLMLRVYFRTRDPKLYQALELTLDKMAAGGIYDQLGGGFARYSVDDHWAVPHFEKMLYDNAQLIKLYAEANELIKANDGYPRRYYWLIHDTYEYIVRDMRRRGGGFYASEDADSEGEEGKFYVWTPSQIKDVLGQEDGEFACRAYGVTEEGNFDHGRTVLHGAVDYDSEEGIHLRKLREKLFDARKKRVRPGRDENIITSWNALMIQALCAMDRVNGRVPSYGGGPVGHAQLTADFILDEMSMTDGGIYRVWFNGETKVPGFLEDYAFLANALFDLYEVGIHALEGSEDFIHHAIRLVDLILKKFWDSGLYSTPSDGEKLIHRPRSSYDHALPSGISASLFALLRAYYLTDKDLYRQRAEFIWRQYGGAAVQNPFNFAHLIAASEFMHQDLCKILFSDNDCIDDMMLNSTFTYNPSRVIARAPDVPMEKNLTITDKKSGIYVCQNQICTFISDRDKISDYLRNHIKDDFFPIKL